MIRIAFVGRRSLFSDPGGDTIQVVKTAQYINEMDGFSVEVFHYDDDIKNHIENFDVFHFFSLTDACEYYSLFFQVKAKGKKIFLSPIFVDYFEFTLIKANWMFRIFIRLLGADRMEYFKNVVKYLLKKKVVDSQYLRLGHRAIMKRIIENSDAVLPNSNSEMQRLASHCFISFNAKVIPNGIDKNIFLTNSDDTDMVRKKVLCIGRIECRKNQHNVISAINNLNYNLTLIGKYSVNQTVYNNKVKRMIENHPNVELKSYMEQEQLIKVIREHDVHILASWFETTGLVSLEAASQGLRIVVSDRGDVYDYFKDDAFYCDPSDVNSIMDCIEKAMYAPHSKKLGDRTKNIFTWENAAKETVVAYSGNYFV